MKEKIITQELAKLYEKQGYLEDSLTCYLSLYEQTKDNEFAKAIEKIRTKLSLVENESNNSTNNLLDEKPETYWKKTSEPSVEDTDEDKTDSKRKDNKSTRALTLFEEWVSMIILEKKIQNFKKIQVNYE